MLESQISQRKIMSPDNENERECSHRAFAFSPFIFKCWKIAGIDVMRTALDIIITNNDICVSSKEQEIISAVNIKEILCRLRLRLSRHDGGEVTTHETRERNLNQKRKISLTIQHVCKHQLRGLMVKYVCEEKNIIQIHSSSLSSSSHCWNKLEREMEDSRISLLTCMYTYQCLGIWHHVEKERESTPIFLSFD